MIKFFCPECNQKLGVPAQFAGRTVKCTRCGGAVQVPIIPGAAVGAGTGAARKAQPRPRDQALQEDDFFSDSVESDSEGESETQGQTCPNCGTVITPGANFCPGCRYRFGPRVEYQQVSEGGESAEKSTSVFRWVLAIGAGMAVAVLGALLWGWVACKTEMEFGILAWVLGALVGLVMVLAASRRGPLLGVIAAILSILCILLGKYFVAKWYVMPMMREEALKLQKQMDKMFQKLPKTASTGAPRLSDEEIEIMIHDPEIMFTVMCHNLCTGGKWKEEFRDLVLEVHLAGKEPPAGREKEIQEGIEEAQQAVESLNDVQRKSQLLLYQAKLTGDAGQFEEHVVKSITEEIMSEDSGKALKEAYKATFSLVDIIWIFLAVGSSYKIAAYEKG